MSEMILCVPGCWKDRADLLGRIITVEPKGCEKKEITDTTVVGAAPNGRDPWTERWTFDTCGKKAAVDVSFTPVAGGGTNWNATAVK